MKERLWRRGLGAWGVCAWDNVGDEMEVLFSGNSVYQAWAWQYERERDRSGR